MGVSEEFCDGFKSQWFEKIKLFLFIGSNEADLVHKRKTIQIERGRIDVADILDVDRIHRQMSPCEKK